MYTAPVGPRAYIGGGNIAGVIGVSPFRTPLDEYHVILGDSPEIDQETERFFRRRKALEPFAATVLQDRGFTIYRQNHRHQDEGIPFFRAELDAEVVGGDAWPIDNAEFKSVHPMAAKEWGHDGDPDGAPTYVTAQAQWGLGLTGRARGFVVAVIGFDDSRVYPIPAAPDVIGYMREKAVKFWENHVLRKDPPAPTTVEDVLRWIEPDPSKVLEASDTDLAHDVAAFIEARTVSKESEAKVDVLKARIQLAMSDATTLTLRGKPVITWKKASDGAKTDWKALAAEFGPGKSQIDRHTATVPGSRRFLVK